MESRDPHTTRRRTFLAGLGAVPVVATAHTVTSAGTASADTSARAGTDVVVDPAIEAQEIHGFGGMNHPIWIDDLTSDQVQTVFGNGPQDLGFSILRIPVPENREQWDLLLPTALQAIDLGAIVFASPWNPPEEMTETFELERKQGTGTDYPAEVDTTLVRAVVGNEGTGFSGDGYVEFLDDDGASVTWHEVVITVDGDKHLEFRYALAQGTKYLDVYVNGEVVVTDVEFPATGSDSTWGRVAVHAHMDTGDNEVQLVTTGTGGPRLDQFNAGGLVRESDARRLRRDMYGAYTEHLNDFTAHLSAGGVDLHAISFQNEPDYAHEWTWWTDEEILEYMREYAGQLTTRVIAPESFQYVKSPSDVILNDPVALENLDILGAHIYGTQPEHFPYPLFEEKGEGKDLWMTEVYHPNSSSDANLWSEALETAQNVHNSMVLGQFQAYIWWYIRRFYSPLGEDGQITKRGYSIAHYSKFVRPGDMRIEIGESPTDGVLLSAYRTLEDRVVVVAINMTDEEVSQRIGLGDNRLYGVESWLTDETRSLEPAREFRAPRGRLTAYLPAHSVATFVARRLGR